MRRCVLSEEDERHLMELQLSNVERFYQHTIFPRGG